jgi:FlaA1/EpsC-like NDP-sugar epimerase
MGATKRCAELLLRGMSGCGTEFVVVRFGNVLGSNGSVVPIFKKQIERGGPVTITHPDVTRYFMTIPEAVELVLQAGVIGRDGDLFMLEMGDPVRIADLAKNMIELSGGIVGEDIEIRVTGLRPGEKLHEELAYTHEDVAPTDIPKLLRHRNKDAVPESFMALLAELKAAAETGDDSEIRKLLWQAVGKNTSVG